MTATCAPLIGWHTLSRGNPPVASDGTNTAPLANGVPYRVWQTTLTAAPVYLTWDITGSVVDVDYVSIASHNLTGASVAFQHADDPGGPWTTVASTVVSGDGSILLPFEGVSAPYWRLAFSSPATLSAHVGVVYFGRLFTPYRGLSGGHRPVILNRLSSLRTNLTERGKWAGRSIDPGAYKASLTFSAIPEAEYRSAFDPFVEYAVLYPFFIVERPDAYPDEVFYCWGTADVTPKHKDVGKYLDVTVEAVALPVATQAFDPIRLTSPPYPIRNQEAVQAGPVLQAASKVQTSFLVEEAMTVESDIVGGEVYRVFEYVDQDYIAEGQDENDYFEAMTVESDIVGGEVVSIYDFVDQDYIADGQTDADYFEALTAESDIVGGEVVSIYDFVDVPFQQPGQSSVDYFEALSVESDIVGGSIEDAS